MGGCCESRQLDLTNKKYISTDSTSFSNDSQIRRTYLHAILSGIQEQFWKNRQERLKVCSRHSDSHDTAYIKLIEKLIEEEKVRTSELVQNLTSQFGSFELIEKELYSDIVSYLELRGIGEKEVKDWIVQKTRILKLQGKQLTSKIRNASRGANAHLNKVQIFQTMIEDKCITDKGFLLSIASQYIYTNHIRQKEQWVSSLFEIQKEVDFMRT